MELEKAIKLDRILRVLKIRTGLTKLNLEGILGESVSIKELYSLKTHIYKGRRICISKFLNGKTRYKVTVAGVAFRDDESFKAEVEKEVRKIEQISIENKSRKRIFWISIVSATIALCVFVFSIIGTCTRDANYYELERRIDELEQNQK